MLIGIDYWVIYIGRYHHPHTNRKLRADGSLKHLENIIFLSFLKINTYHHRKENNIN